MAHVVAYSHFTSASVPKDSFDETWFAVMSWKGYLQSFPGFIGLRLAARPLENGDVRLHISTTWEEPEQLEEWLNSSWSAETLFTSIRKPSYDVITEAYEIFA